MADKFMGSGIYSSARLAEAELEKIMDVSGVDEDQAAAMKLMAADVPAPVDEADALFASPDGEPVENSIEQESRVVRDESVDEIEGASDEVNGNTIAVSESPENTALEEVKTETDNPENP